MAYTFFVILIVLLSVLMVFIVLIQESKGGGLSSEFSSANAIMGVRKTTDGVEKLTWGLAAAMVVISVVCAYVAPLASTDQSVLEQSATETQTTNPTNTQGFGASQQSSPAAGTQKGANAPAGNTKPTAPTAPKTPAN